MKTITWKNKKELPVFKKLERFKFDINKLVDSYNEILSYDWDSINNEYSKFTEIHKDTTKSFDKNYAQYALTVFDETFNLSKRKEKSGSMWDKIVAMKKPEADERFYRKRKDNLPSYLHHVLDSFGEGVVHKSRFALLPAHANIKPHIDHDTRYGVRVHIPIITNDKSVYGATDHDGKDKEEHFPADGGAWFINPGVRHWVRNEGDTDRIHLILSCDSQAIL